MSKTDRVLAAGGVLWRGDPTDPEVALVHRPRYDDWSLPKGKLEPGEQSLICALREVREETGEQSLPGRLLGRLRYPQPGPNGADTTKHVKYWALRSLGGQFLPDDEVDQLLWLPPKQAARRLSYPRDRAPLANLSALPLELTTVVLVRHARAGHRSQWNGPDDLRPLDAVGQRQSLLLRDLLSCYLPAAVYSAEPVRCQQTIAPLAERLGLPVATESVFADHHCADDPAAALVRLREIAAGGHVAVVCSQGGTIPWLVSELSRIDKVALGAPRSRKGSVWVLFFDGSQLRDGYYLADLEPPVPL